MRHNKNYSSHAEHSKHEGYTIIETLIFLAISAAMFLSAILLVGGQQRKSEFNTGIRDVESQLIDVMNDVSTGYYDNRGNFSCSATVPGPPVVTSMPVGAPVQGTNAACTFVGKVLQFGSSDNGAETIDVYTLIGRRQTGTPARDVRSVSEAKPVILDQADTVIRLPYGIKIMKVSYTSGGVQDRGSIALINRFAGNTGAGGITGTQDIDLVAIKGTLIGQSKADAKVRINSDAAATPLKDGEINPISGVTLCFNSGGTKQHAEIVIGGTDRQMSTALIIKDGDC